MWSGQWWQACGDFVDRASEKPVGRIEADLLVGWDGIHCVIRRQFHPDEGPVKWDGTMLWRAVTIGEPFLSGRTMVLAGHLDRYVVVYPISKRHESEGLALINWVACVRTADGQPMPPQDWDHTARLDDVLEAFTSFRSTSLTCRR